MWGEGNRPGWRRSRLRSRAGCWLSWSHRRSSGKGRGRGTARSRRWRRNNSRTLRMSMDGMNIKKTSASGLEPCGVINEADKATKKQRAGVLNSACCACPRASRHSRICPLWSHRCWRCACRCTHFYVAIYVAICSWIAVSGGILFTPPVGDSRLLSAVTDIFTINFAFNSCWDSCQQMNSCPPSTQVSPFDQCSLHLCAEFS